MPSSAVYVAATAGSLSKSISAYHRDQFKHTISPRNLYLGAAAAGAGIIRKSYAGAPVTISRPALLRPRTEKVRQPKSATTTTAALSLPAAASSLSRREIVISLAVAVALPLVLGSANAILNNPSSDFYKNLKKPSINPPNWLFGVAWGILYPVIGFASWLVWVQGGGFTRAVAVPLSVYAGQLVLNLLWPPIFFSAHNIGLALADIIALFAAAAATAALFLPFSKLAAGLFVPYLAWIAFATYLNYQYLSLNTTPAATSTSSTA